MSLLPVGTEGQSTSLLLFANAIHGAGSKCFLANFCIIYGALFHTPDIIVEVDWCDKATAYFLGGFFF